MSKDILLYSSEKYVCELLILLHVVVRIHNLIHHNYFLVLDQQLKLYGNEELVNSTNVCEVVFQRHSL